MDWLQTSLALAPPALFLGAGFLPFRDEERRNRATKRIVEPVAALATLAALAAAATLFRAESLGTRSIPLPRDWFPGILFDSLSATTLLLVSFVGWATLRFSIRYLEGDPRHGLFLQRICLALGAALTLGIARDLVTLAIGWGATSASLHLLLTHFSDRPRAHAAARQKFLVSRLGDVFLLGGILLTYVGFGTVDLPALFALLEEGDLDAPLVVSGASALFALAAIAKSAQLPFHAWLPETMEAPTPVSALMHAGIVNAGGILMIRLAPMMSLSPAALHLLAIVGASTAVFGSLAMTAQTSVKRGLAYSTVAQMGFMILQCGLGAFAAAGLHLVAHSLYKAHAFLSSGSAVDAAARTRFETGAGPGPKASLESLVAAIVVGAAICGSGIYLFGAAGKTGSSVLFLVLGTAVVHLLWSAFQTRRPAIVGAATAIGALVCVGYLGAYWIAERAFAASLSYAVPQSSSYGAAVVASIGALFVGGFLVQALAQRLSHWRLIQALYVHLSNGLYFDVRLRQAASRLWPASSRSG